jgi:hypothetical protein
VTSGQDADGAWEARRRHVEDFYVSQDGVSKLLRIDVAYLRRQV